MLSMVGWLRKTGMEESCQVIAASSPSNFVLTRHREEGGNKHAEGVDK